MSNPGNPIVFWFGIYSGPINLKFKKIKACLQQFEINIAVIPRGLTSVIQPLGVSLNKPFKNAQRMLSIAND